jgi:hypothetical protein
MRRRLRRVGHACGVGPSDNRRNLSLRYWSGSLELLDRVVGLPVQMLEVRLRRIHVATDTLVHRLGGVMEVGLGI